MSIKFEADPFKAISPEEQPNTDAFRPYKRDLDFIHRYISDGLPKYKPKRLEAPTLGDTFSLVCRVMEGHIRQSVKLSLAPFFPSTDEPLWAFPEGPAYPQEDVPYTVDNFDCGTFATNIHSKFHLDRDSKWSLCLKNDLDSPPQLIRCVEDLHAALDCYAKFFKEDPKGRHVVFLFLLVVEPEFEDEEGEREAEYEDGDDKTDCVSTSDSLFQKSQNLLSGLKKITTDMASSLSRSPSLLSEEQDRSPTSPTSQHTLSRLSFDSDYQSGGESPIRAALGAWSRDLPQQVGILPSLDTNAGRGDVMEGDLHAVLPEAACPSDDEWRLCCSLLLLVPDEHKNPRKRSVPIPATEIKVSPCQFWTAFWMLSCRGDRHTHGGLLADVMGTGKTYVCVIYCLLRAYIFYNVAEVQREWEQREFEEKRGGATSPKKHLPRGVTGDTPCTCGNVTGIECYANPGGITRRIADTAARGASLLMVGQGVIEEWAKVLREGGLNRKFYEPAVFHTTVDRELTPAPDLKQKLKVDVRPSKKAGSLPREWEPTAADMEYTFSAPKEPGKQLERYIFLASHTPGKFVSSFEMPFSFVPKGSKMGEKKAIYACPVGVQLVDEFHKVNAREGAVVKMARDHKLIAGDSFDFWSVTGTPLSNAMNNLTTTMELLQRPEWDAEDHPQHASRVVDLMQLDEAHQKAISAAGSQQDVAAFRAKVDAFFSGGFVTRHTEESKFFGKSIFALQDVMPRKITHYTAEGKIADELVDSAAQEVANRVRDKVKEKTNGNWEQAVRSLDTFNLLLELDILSTFPGAAQIMQGEKLDFTDKGIKALLNQAKDHQVNNVPAFHEVLNDVIHNSPKLGTILSILETMCADQQRRPRKDASGEDRPATDNLRMKKMVIICPRLAEAVFVYLALKKKRPDLKTVFFYSGLLASTKTSILNSFQSLSDGSLRVFVSSFEDGGTGLNLFSANYQIQTGPLRLKGQEDQSFGRTNRQGQQLPCHHYTLIAEDNPLDRIVVATHARKRFVSDPFDIKAELELE